MIIPVRCFTCGKVLANKWRTFEKEREKLRKTSEKATKDEVESSSFFYDEPALGQLLDDLGLDRICCRRHMLSHVDLVDII